MILPERAAVRPRVVQGHGDALPLEDEVLRLLEDGAFGVVAVLGPPGSGRTTALRHLAAVLPPGPAVRLIDDHDPDTPLPPADDRLIVYTGTKEVLCLHRAAFRLARWTVDDLIEYLLHTHTARCAAVMTRLRPADHALFGGEPELWRAVLDGLAAADGVVDARSALHRHLESALPDADLVARARVACLNALLGSEPPTPADFPPRIARLMRLGPVRHLLAGERLADDLHGEGPCDWLARRLPRPLVRTAATLAAESDRAIGHLRRFLTGPEWAHAMTVSLLHAAPGGWVPGADAPKKLAGAYLDGALWSNVDLPGVDLSQADLSKADLRHADLGGADFRGASLRGVLLNRAVLSMGDVTGADLTGADLTDARAAGVLFLNVTFGRARLDGADLLACSFDGSDLTDASLCGADLRRASFVGCRVAGADFGGAELRGATFNGLDLRETSLLGADCTVAHMFGCNLEGLTLPDARFVRAGLGDALLTGSVMPRADLRKATLCRAGLAEIEWEGANLCGADLRGASFHLGSTRSGLVGSTIACEGSKTGFYTDDYEEQHFKAPEDIRKANLRGADLRGARVDGVDFYLVDLRDAVYTSSQAVYFRQCKAILTDPR